MSLHICFVLIIFFQVSSKLKEPLKEAREKAETRLVDYHRKVSFKVTGYRGGTQSVVCGYQCILYCVFCCIFVTKISF